MKKRKLIDIETSDVKILKTKGKKEGFNTLKPYLEKIIKDKANEPKT